MNPRSPGSSARTLMRYRKLLAVAPLLLALWASSSTACIISMPYRPEDVRTADFAVIGRITNYRIVQNPEFSFIDRLGARLSKGTKTFPGDYARFDILVDQVLVGKGPRKLSAIWFPENYGIPDSMSVGAYVIALRKPASQYPPSRDPNMANPLVSEPGTLTVMQGVCSPAFLFEANSFQAKAVERFLSNPTPPSAPSRAD